MHVYVFIHEIIFPLLYDGEWMSIDWSCVGRGDVYGDEERLGLLDFITGDENTACHRSVNATASVN